MKPRNNIEERRSKTQIFRSTPNVVIAIPLNTANLYDSDGVTPIPVLTLEAEK